METQITERRITYYHNGKEFSGNAIRAKDSYFKMVDGPHKDKFIHIMNLANATEYKTTLLDVADGRSQITEDQIESLIDFIGQGINDLHRLGTIRLKVCHGLSNVKNPLLSNIKFNGSEVVYETKGDKKAELMFIKELFTRS